ncbi:hypothetical protein TREES_T100019294 [Tupaia chinensis]|uniref:Uncharacterized protein n=1 Tax=Tupaia chinensis TaxID=246437 RepID=L9L4P7_TUPCH|nr:hypothetical protein TREES_T100019294 [Tupaia chinensis]
MILDFRINFLQSFLTKVESEELIYGEGVDRTASDGDQEPLVENSFQGWNQAKGDKLYWLKLCQGVRLEGRTQMESDLEELHVVCNMLDIEGFSKSVQRQQHME